MSFIIFSYLYFVTGSLFQVEPISENELHRQPCAAAIETMETTIKTQGMWQNYFNYIYWSDHKGKNHFIRNTDFNLGTYTHRLIILVLYLYFSSVTLVYGWPMGKYNFERLQWIWYAFCMVFHERWISHHSSLESHPGRLHFLAYFTLQVTLIMLNTSRKVQDRDGHGMDIWTDIV